jgi:hypothetical protein
VSSLAERIKLKEEARLDKQFGSKWFTLFIFIPSIITLAASILLIAIGDSEGANVYIVAAIVANPLGGVLEAFRRKIIRQDQAIRELQEKLATPQRAVDH